MENIRKGAQGDDCNHCLRMVLCKWLQKSYEYSKYGPPTWRMLVKAVDDPFGGNNCALAETIASKHPGMHVHKDRFSVGGNGVQTDVSTR